MQTAANSFASLWLIAAEPDQTLFSGIVERLARRHGSPRFEPHMTLLGDIRSAPARLVAVAEKIACTAPAFTVRCRDVVSGPAFFRSFYALFDIVPELAQLRAAAERDIAPAGDVFMPHVSLAYGTIAEPGKSDSIAEMRPALAARSVTFDRLVLTNSGGDTPIAEWRTVKSFRLG